VVTARNSAGSTTATLTITVQEPPAFTLQPFTKTVGVGTDAAFAIQTTGTPAPTYVWIRNAADTIKGAVSATVTLDSVQGADDKSYYRCVARNAAGSVTSALCTLRVVSANFSATPLTGADSVTVKFTDLSTGGAASYRWEFGDGDSAISSNPTHKYPAPGKYSVKQTVSAAGIIETALKADYITVNYSKPRPGFGADTTQASDSLLVHFRDQSSGVITGRKWSFGDKSPVDTSANPSHLYKDTGSFTVKLVVTGPGGTDSATRANLIFVYAKSDNPVRIKGQRISASSVEITFSNFSSVQTSAKTPLPPFADTVSLWFKRGGLPLSTQNDSVLKKYSLIQMQKNVSGSFKDTIGVPYSAPASLVYYGFNTALVWNDRSRSPMKPGNGDSLLMQDTVKPTNTLTFWGIYLGGDSAALNVEGVSGLDTAKDSAVGLWYGFKESANFSDPSYTRWFTVSAVLNKAVNNRFTYILHEPLSGGDTLWVYAAEAVMGRNQLQSAVKDTSFKAGRLRPANPVRLQAKVVSPTSIRLSWWDMSTGAALTGVDSIVIWSGVKPVPALNASAPGGFTALTPPVADTTLLKSGLNEKTRYYFGAQTFKDGLWSLVTDSSSAGDSTPAILDTARPVNTIKNVFLTFDTTQNGIAVNWRIDAPDTGEEIGIAYSLTTYPADTASPPQQIARVKGASDSAALTLGEPLVFDSTYYVSLWLRKNGGKWSPPTSSSVAKITLPSLSWQTVTYFTKFPDTVTAFGGRIRLANDSGVVTPATDKLIYDKTLTDSLNGFAPVSIGFYFQQKIASSPFHVGIAYDTALLPKGYNAGDIRIYHDSAGSWFVERGTIIDTARNMAWVLTRKPDFPFIAMVDTMPPSITVLSSTTAPVHGGVAVADSFAIRDNVANMTWNYRYAKGEDSYAAGDSMVGVSRGAIDSVITSIPGVMVNQNNGTRVQFIVGDGVRWKTADVSRQVYCDSALNVIKTSEITWYPLRVSTKFDSTGVKHVLRNLSKSGEDWYYDNTKFRLFRWYSYDDNADSAQKWVEYSEKNDLMFTFDPGKLFWIKTRKAMTLNLGASVTPSLRSPSPVSLAPKAITDFSLPLGFDVFIGDVFASTDADTVNNRGIIADSLQVYSFTADSTGHYRAVALHLGHFAKSLYHLADPADTLTSKGGGYCVYNPYNVAVRLLIPPVPVSMSKMRAAVAKKAKAPAAPGNWALAVTGRTAEGMLLSTVYCGHNEGGAGRVYLPAMPMMDGVGIRACDEAKRQFGHVISGGASAKEGGETYPLAFCNQSGGPRTIVFQVEGLESLPKSMRAVIANFATGSFEDARTPLIVAMNDGENAYRRLVVGTDEYLAKVKIGLRVFRLDLTGAYPNPFARRLIIRFNLPEFGLDQVRFSIVNMSGRKVWERAVVCGALAPGAQELAWDGNSVSGRPVAAGMYVLRMTALDGRGKRVGSFEKKITYLP
jgi:PKD repeat protein